MGRVRKGEKMGGRKRGKDVREHVGAGEVEVAGPYPGDRATMPASSIPLEGLEPGACSVCGGSLRRRGPAAEMSGPPPPWGAWPGAGGCAGRGFGSSPAAAPAAGARQTS